MPTAHTTSSTMIAMMTQPMTPPYYGAGSNISNLLTARPGPSLHIPTNPAGTPVAHVAGSCQRSGLDPGSRGTANVPSTAPACCWRLLPRDTARQSPAAHLPDADGSGVTGSPRGRNRHRARRSRARLLLDAEPHPPAGPGIQRAAREAPHADRKPLREKASAAVEYDRTFVRAAISCGAGRCRRLPAHAAALHPPEPRPRRARRGSCCVSLVESPRVPRPPARSMGLHEVCTRDARERSFECDAALSGVDGRFRDNSLGRRRPEDARRK